MSTVLITGTSKGIGYNTALMLARAGHSVIATMRTPSASDLEEVAKAENLPVTVMAMDVDNDASVANVFDEVGERVDALVNNAGIYSINATEEETFEQVRSVMETNYFGAVRCIKAVLPLMRARASGHIINVSSVAGRIAFAASGAYCASKFALEAYTESLAQEVKAHGVKVALVEPGIIDTPMAQSNLPQYVDDTIYPHGSRLHAFFVNPDKPEAPADMVAQTIGHVLETDDPRLRFPVGPDAHPLIGWRHALSDENWVDIGGWTNAQYFERFFLDSGIDLRGVNG